jgi:hypothetical protein
MTNMIPSDDEDALDTSALDALLARMAGGATERVSAADGTDYGALRQRIAETRANRPYDTLLQLGLGLMASKSPSLLGAIGEAGQRAIPAVRQNEQAALSEAMSEAKIGGLEAQQRRQQTLLEQQNVSRQQLRRSLSDEVAAGSLNQADADMILTNPQAQAAYVRQRFATQRPLPTVTTAEGVFARNPDGTLGARLGGAPAAPSATVNMPPTETAIMKKNVELLGTAREAISNQGDIIPRLDIIQRLALAGNESGPLTSALLPLRKVLVELGAFSPEEAEKVSNQQLLASTASFIIPRMRIPGSGASSDLDVRMFTQAVPNLSNSPAANLLIAGGMKQMYQRQQKVVDAMERWLSDPKNKGAMAGFGEWADQNIAPAFPRIPTVNGMEARDKLPAGTVYILEMPDGVQQFAVKR